MRSFAPLATIKAWLTGLCDDDVDFDAARRDILQAAVDEVDRLNNLVGNLVDMTRLQTGALQATPQPTDVAAVAMAACSAVGWTRSHPPRHPRGPSPWPRRPRPPRTRSRQPHRNALRHSPEGMPCTLQAHGDDSVLELRVVDHGPGIPADQRARAVEPFQRLEPGGGGVGLGLAVARGLAEAMGAELGLEDTPPGA